VQGAGAGVQDRGGNAGDRAAFELGVVLDADPGERGLATTQPGYSPSADVGIPACSGVILARRESKNSWTSAR
jgi:hypothetical protein